MILTDLHKSAVAGLPILFLDIKENEGLWEIGESLGKHVEALKACQVSGFVKATLKRNTIYYYICSEQTMINKIIECKQMGSVFNLAVNIPSCNGSLFDKVLHQEMVSIILASDRETSDWKHQFYRAQSCHMYVDPWFQPYLVKKYRKIKEQEEKREKELLLREEKAKEWLSNAEIRIFEKILEGKSNRRIAEECYLAVATVNNHVSHIAKKINAKDRTHTIKRAIEDGWVTLQ